MQCSEVLATNGYQGGITVPMVGTQRIILVDGRTMILPPPVRVFERDDGYVLSYGRARDIRVAYVGALPNRHDIARALLALGVERPRDVRGYATASNPPALALL